MPTLAIMAQYDPRGRVGPHVLRHLEALSEVADRVLVVTTTGLRDEQDISALQQRAELVRRENVGYDFYSYKHGLDLAGDLSGYDDVVLCNDSYVGPVVPYRQIFGAMAERPVDFWGITQTQRRTRHVQSFFVVFRPWVVRSQAFLRFWAELEPVSDRRQVIARYELGLSQAMLGAGFELGSYFEEDAEDRRLGRARHVWWAAHAVRRQPPASRRAALRRLPFEPWNPMACLADRVLDGRLPVVKIDTLRYDPYQLGSDALLAACERRYRREFAGVRAFLEETAPFYPARPMESPGPTVPPTPFRQLLGYRGAA